MITSEKSVTVKELQKGQFVRVVDVFVIAPILIVAGMNKSLHSLLRVSLLFIGISTAVFNGRNWYVNYVKYQANKKSNK